MATWKRFEDIEAWKKARVLSASIHRLTSAGPCAKDFVFIRQIREAALSIMSNIAEGFERDGKKEFMQFLSIAKASAAEVKSHLYAAVDVGYCGEAEFNELYGLATEIGKMLAGLMRYLRQSEVKGLKYASGNNEGV